METLFSTQSYVLYTDLPNIKGFERVIMRETVNRKIEAKQFQYKFWK